MRSRAGILAAGVSAAVMGFGAADAQMRIGDNDGASRSLAILMDSEPQYIRVELIAGGRTARTGGPSHTDSVGQGDAQAALGEDGAAQLHGGELALEDFINYNMWLGDELRTGRNGADDSIGQGDAQAALGDDGAAQSRDIRVFGLSGMTTEDSINDLMWSGPPLRRTGSGSPDDVGPADPAAVALALCAASLAEAGAQGGACVFAPADMVQSGADRASAQSIAFSGRVATGSGPDGGFAARVYDLAPAQTAGEPQIVLTYDPEGFHPSSLCASGCGAYGLRPVGSGNGGSGLARAAGQAAVDFGVREAAARATGGRGGAASEPTGARGGVRVGSGSGSGTANRALGALGRAATSRAAESVPENTTARFLDMELVEAGLTRRYFSSGLKIEVPDTDQQAYQEIYGRAEAR